MTSAQARAMANARWRRQREAEAMLPADIQATLNEVLGVPGRPAPAAPGPDAASVLMGIQNTLAEVGPSVVRAAAELGLDRATAERLGDLALWLVAETVEQAALRAGHGVVAEALEFPTPEAWRATVAWPVLFDAAGASVATGAMERAPRAEMEAAA
jgi:hypothetical protein